MKLISWKDVESVLATCLSSWGLPCPCEKCNKLFLKHLSALRCHVLDVEGGENDQK